LAGFSKRVVDGSKTDKGRLYGWRISPKSAQRGGVWHTGSRPPVQGKLELSLPFGLVPAEATTGKLERTEPQETVEQIAAHRAECDRDRWDRGLPRFIAVSSTFGPKSNRIVRPPLRIAIG
jgi:hypothetical protein